MAVVEMVEQLKAPAAETHPRRSPWLGPLAALLLAALACAAVAAFLAAGRLAAAADRDASREAVLRAAHQHVMNFTTIDHRTLDRDLRRVLRGSTGDFHKEFKAGTADLSSVLTGSEAVSNGEVLEAGLVSADADSARVLVVADSTVRNTASTEPQKRHYRMQLDLVVDDGRWLVSDLRFLG